MAMHVRPSGHRLSHIETFHSTRRRWTIRAENRPEEAQSRVDDDGVSESASNRPAFMKRRSGPSKRKLRRSKRMEALSAALASKKRNAKDATQATASPALDRAASAPELYQEADTESDAELREAAMNPSFKVKIPYNAEKKKDVHFENDPEDLCVLPKPIYIISDCTGDSAAKTVKAALGQFESSIQAHCPASLMMFRFVSDEKRICQIVEDASKEDALVVFTLVNPDLVAVAHTTCALFEVKYVDLWSDLLNIMEDHLDAMRSVWPLNHPNRGPRRVLDPEYFKRIEAVEYTRKMDDGAQPELWNLADILLLGVSRSGKTPLSIYLGQQGYKVANLPLVKGISIPAELYEIDQSKIFALTIEPQHLFKIRRSRMGSMGVSNGRSMYADLKGVVDELEFAHAIYRTNPEWPVLDVTQMGVEETAAKIERILSDRHGLSERVLYA